MSPDGAFQYQVGCRSSSTTDMTLLTELRTEVLIRVNLGHQCHPCAIKIIYEDATNTRHNVDVDCGCE